MNPKISIAEALIKKSSHVKQVEFLQDFGVRKAGDIVTLHGTLISELSAKGVIKILGEAQKLKAQKSDSFSEGLKKEEKNKSKKEKKK